MKTTHCIFLPLIFLIPTLLFSQKKDNAAIKEIIQKFREDPRGPYLIIRWLCDDETIREARDPCPEEVGGVQRALYKPVTKSLARTNHIFLGQILATTEQYKFWDKKNYHSRLKQYLLGKYLYAVDNGWVNEKAQFYRGAFQVEDEENWGHAFLLWALTNDENVRENYYLLRQTVKDLPHQGNNNLMQNIRIGSKIIAEEYPEFENLRVKIHGQPELADIQKVKAFQVSNQSNFDENLLTQFTTLIADMQQFYQPVDLNELQKYVRYFQKDSDIREALSNYITHFATEKPGIARSMATAEILHTIRENIIKVGWNKGRLALLDASEAIERILFTEISYWKPETPKEIMEKICYSGMAAYGTGFIENWEWEALSNTLVKHQNEEISIREMNDYLDSSRRLVEWGASMNTAVFQDVVDLYIEFEPLAYGFYDDRVRGSILLNLGETVGDLGDFIAKEVNLSNEIFDISNQSHGRGLNPGYAKGELVILEEAPEGLAVSQDKIYVFNRPPSDLKPVAGIATVTEGNMVSHVQLLARNLGIPNAVISGKNLEDLKAFQGKEIFYAVSNSGNMLMKLAENMTATEKELFAVKARKEERITVPTDKMDLTEKKVIDMGGIGAEASGKICGPKAANLGQLKQLFPDKVVEGLVIPFGIFREHMEQVVPTLGFTYWQFLNDVFNVADEMRAADRPKADIETYQLCELEVLQTMIKEMPLKPDFEKDLKEQFQQVFGARLGRVPVFLRSDTNMEDLEDFTGAGLNLTLFNVVKSEEILKGIKKVWASPYKERSFKWRQSYLLNPENVFPSILIIPSVDVDFSGVVITKGITSGNSNDLTVAFSRGAGGAVDGQAAESYLLRMNGNDELLSPAREALHRRLPKSGGSDMKFATYEEAILNKFHRYDLKLLSLEAIKKMPSATGVKNTGPWDIELGFKDDAMWLFQIRPFVENKNAATSAYLESISPKLDLDKKINLAKSI